MSQANLPFSTEAKAELEKQVIVMAREFLDAPTITSTEFARFVRTLRAFGNADALFTAASSTESRVTIAEVNQINRIFAEVDSNL